MRQRLIVPVIALVLPLGSIGFTLHAQVNPFLSPSAEQSGDCSVGKSPSFGKKLLESRAYRTLVTTQKQIQSFISRTITSQKESGSVGGLAVLICVSFAYGFLHALGPGHRKIILSSYFLSEGGKMCSGVATAYGIGIVHAGSAVALMYGLYALLTGPIMNNFNSISLDIERVSYYLIILVGLVLLGMNAFSHDGRKPDSSSDGRAIRTGGRLVFILASGAVPCPGAAAVLIFGIGNGAAGLGILASISMSLGMGSLLSLLVVITILIRRLAGDERIARRFVSGKRIGVILERVLQIGGALAIIAFGVLMILPS